MVTDQFRKGVVITVLRLSHQEGIVNAYETC